MQIFTCPACGGLLYFDNLACSCGAEVGFDPETQRLRNDLAFCVHRADIGCNWVAESGNACRGCAMTEMLPDLAEPDNLPLWTRSEQAKRWMLANLARWGWFNTADPGPRPVFRMLSEQTSAGEADVTMGHAGGIITINVTEASEAVRAVRRGDLGELYRTMLGHMRHEMAHFLFERLAANPDFIPAFRNLFGDESADYGAAVEAHYANPQPADETRITSYATMHPHEDWAETVAHLLHLTDLVDSAAAAGLAAPKGPPPGYDAYAEGDAMALTETAVALALAVNHVNRAVDVADIYPFVLPDGVRAKMGFVLGWLRQPA